MNRTGAMSPMGRRFVLLLSFVLLASCAHKRTVSDAQIPAGTVAEVESFRLSDPEPPQVVDQELESTPTEMNALVQQWINYFQGRGRPHMERYLARSSRYSSLMKRILKQNGLPEDLIYIALIESGFSSRATSRAAAVGYWQFIKGTGKRYGLEISGLVDERRDPVLATQAAAEYFKGLYSVFGSWYLAMASYNVGENRVKREVMNHYTRDFWELARKKRFPKETINYVPKFIAAKMIGKNPAKYGFTDIEYEKPIEFDMVKVSKAVNLRVMASRMGVEYEEFKQLNPKFKGEVAPAKSNGVLELRIPVGQTQVAMSAAAQSYVDRVELIADAGDTSTYKIRAGDSLYTVARKYRTTVANLRDINDIKPGRKLRIGQRIQVPDRSTRKAAVKVAAAKPIEKPKQPTDEEKATTNPEVTKNGVVYYIVQPGDTLSAIADDYDSSINELRKMNKLGKGGVLKVGMRLRVPKDDGLPKDPNENKANVAAQTSGPVEVASSESAAEAPAASASSAEGNAAPNHVVRPGENLTTIAKKYGVTIQALRKANKLSNRSTLRVGARLVIPSDIQDKGIDPANFDSGSRMPASTNYKVTLKRDPASVAKMKSRVPTKLPNKKVAVRRAPHKVHVVRRGENLTAIAAKYGVSLNTLKKKNQMASGSKVLVGARLLIPAAEAGE
ncbi:MAG: LysM peptidoglycan-binding domain-containing protein [Bdellovibrionaceae bacterium]|nr:LysM peptidoglycan-binding domain-containing protein [Pseudobdellovibrionaceae bacterium]